MPEPWEEYTATQEDAPWEDFGKTAVAEPPAPSDLFDAQLSAAPVKEAPGFFRMLGRQTVAPLAAAKKGLDLPLSTDDELKDYLEKKFLESKGEKEPTTMGKVGGFIGGLLGTIGEAVVGSGAAMPGIATTFASQAGHDAFVNAGVKALAEGKTIDEALNIAKGIGPIGATVGAATTLAFPAKVATSFRQAGKQGVPLGAAGAAGQLLENIAERQLGLKTPVLENVPTAGLTMAALPVGQYAVGRGLRAIRGRPVTEPTQPPPLPEPGTYKTPTGEYTVIYKPKTERPTDAISKRETAPIPMDEASRGRGAVVEEVRQPETSADVQAQQAKAGEQPAPAEGKPALGDVKGPEGEVFSQKQVDELKAQYPDLKVVTLRDDATGETRTVLDTGTNWGPTTKRKVVVPGTVGGTVQRNESAIRATEKVVSEKPIAVPEPKPAEAPSAKPKIPPELDTVIKGLMSQKSPGEIWIYHGEGGPEGGGFGGARWSSNPAEALSYGPRMSAIRIPVKEAEKYHLTGGSGQEYKLPNEWIKQSRDLGTFERPAIELEAPKPAEPTPVTEPAKRTSEVPKPVMEWVEKWRKAEKRYRRARRQEPSDIADADEARIGAEGMFRQEAEKAGLSQKQFDDLREYAKRTETEQTPEVEDLAEVPKAEPAKAAEPAPAPEPEPMRVGPGAAVPADVQSTQSDMAQLANTMENVASPKKTATQRVAEAKQAVSNLKTELPKNIGEMARNGVERLSAIGSAIKTGLTKLPEFTQFKRIMGEWLGANQQADLELRQFVKTINKKIPQDRQVAITNYIQADGDAAVLRQRAAASKTPKLRKGYEDALSLNRDEKIAAEQIRIYLDNRLQEGIDSGILDHGLDNYITQIWKRPNPVTQKLISDISIGKLQPNFKYARQRLLESYFEGEQKGLVPANKSVSALIAAYDQSFNRSLAARAFIKNLTEGKASDGRPLVEVSGSGRLVGDEGAKQAVLVKSKTKPEDIADYRTIDHPALRKWKWASKTPDGTDVFVEGQLLVHPEIYSHLRNVLSRSAFRQYAFPRAVLKTERLIKELMFSASGFHQVQETLHALGHRVNPTNLETLDMSKPWLKEGVDHGLQISDYNALENFSEGLNTGPLISKIPVIGKRILGPYTEWLFQDNIPRIKATMYKHAMERNLERFDSQLRSGKITRDQVAELTAKQANAAFGELNYKWMGRNLTFQDALRTFLIAPDFLEARGRFVGQALKPYGREQLVALGLLAATQYITARILNQIFDKNPHLEPENAFKLIVGKHSYELRSVPGDILHLLSRPHQFATARISPLIRQAIEGITGRDWRGVKRDAMEQVKDFARLPTPISLRKEDDQRWWETFLNAFGVHERSYTAGQEIGDLARKYRESVKGKASVEVLEDTDSPFRKLRVALDVGNERDAMSALRELRQTRKDKQIFDSMKSHLTAPFTGLSKADEAKFRRSLQPVEMEKYREALAERRERFKKFQMIWSKRGPRAAP